MTVTLGLYLGAIAAQVSSVVKATKPTDWNYA